MNQNKYKNSLKRLRPMFTARSRKLRNILEDEYSFKHEAAKPEPIVLDGRPVVAIYGPHEGVSFKLLLQRMALEHIILQNVPGSEDRIVEKFRRFIINRFEASGFAYITLDPVDKEGYTFNHPTIKYPARQNVRLQLGINLFTGRHSCVALMQNQSVDFPSNIAGIIFYPSYLFEDAKLKLFRELIKAGYNPISNYQ